MRAILSRLSKLNWFAVTVTLLIPAGLLILALTVFPSSIRNQVRTTALQHPGDIAAIWGLIVSIYVLFIAEGARAAAREARLRTALEDLEDAAEKCAQVRLFARQENWSLANLRASEVATLCRSTITRWEKDDALEDSRNELLTVTTQMHTILEETDKPVPDKTTILRAQRSSDDKLAAVVGRMQGEESRRT